MSSLRAKQLAHLRAQVGRLERPVGAGMGIAFDHPAFDEILPRGLSGSCLHEIVGEAGDAAATGFAAWLLSRFANGGSEGADKPVLWCQRDSASIPYGPGLARFGLRAERLLLVRVRETNDVLWAMEESLRSRSFAAVLGEGTQFDLTATRRLQLAAERGGATALLLTTPLAGGLSAATTRWRVSAAPSHHPERPRWRLVLDRCRHGSSGTWDLEWNHETHHFDLVSLLGDRPLAAAE